MPLWHYDTLTLWHYETMTLSHSDTLTKRHSDTSPGILDEAQRHTPPHSWKVTKYCWFVCVSVGFCNCFYSCLTWCVCLSLSMIVCLLVYLCLSYFSIKVFKCMYVCTLFFNVSVCISLFCVLCVYEFVCPHVYVYVCLPVSLGMSVFLKTHNCLYLWFINWTFYLYKK